jgi:hypothetical protein
MLDWWTLFHASRETFSVRVRAARAVARSTPSMAYMRASRVAGFTARYSASSAVVMVIVVMG